LILNVFDRLRPKFEEGQRLSALRPIFDAAENLFFSSSAPTQAAPFVRDPLDVKRYMSLVILALLPCVAASLYFFGLRVLVMIAVSYVAGGAVEVLFAVLRKKDIQEGFLVTGLIFPLTLPPALPLWMVAVGIAVGVVVGKEIFGGTGRNLFNPALVGRCFLALGHPSAMSGSWLAPGWGGLGNLARYVHPPGVDAVSLATPLALAKQGEMVALSRLFIGNVSGSIGETCVPAIIFGGLCLLFTRIASWRTVVGAVFSFGALGCVLHAVVPLHFGSVPFHLFAGGFLFAAFFMATDPVTSPITKPARWAYGSLIGILTLLIRNLTGYVEGVMFAILLGNIAAPLLDEAVFRVRIRRLQSEA